MNWLLRNLKFFFYMRTSGSMHSWNIIKHMKMSKVTSCQYESGGTHRRTGTGVLYIWQVHTVYIAINIILKNVLPVCLLGWASVLPSAEREIWVHTDIPRLVVFRSLEVSVLSVPLLCGIVNEGDWIIRQRVSASSCASEKCLSFP